MKIERYLSQRDAAMLGRLAERLLRVRDVKLNAAEKLVDLITGSILLPEHASRPDCVSLYSEVIYRVLGTDDCHSFFVVCPQDANDTLAHVSILTPLVLAVLGRPRGSIVEVAHAGKRSQYIEILDIRPAPAQGTEQQETHGGFYAAQARRPDRASYNRDGWWREYL